MMNFMDYLDKKLNENKVSVSINIKKESIVTEKVEDKIVSRETISQKSKVSEVEDSIKRAKMILEGVPEKITLYRSSKFIEVSTGRQIMEDNYEPTIDEDPNFVSKTFSSDLKHACLL